MVKGKIKGFRQWLSDVIKPKYQATITDDMRAQALSMRRQEHALKQKEKEVAMMERIMNLETTTNPKESAVDMVVRQCMPILMAKLAGGNNTPSLTSNSSPGNISSEGVILTEEQINQLVEANPKLIKYAKKFSDEEIRDYIVQSDPNLSKESIKAIIMKVRS